MQHFPIFVALAGRRVVVSGGQDCAMAKLRLLLKTTANITVVAADPNADVQNLARSGKITLIPRAMEPGDALCAALFYAANDDDVEDQRVARIAHRECAMVNIVDNLSDSQFITPAIVDRDPVTIAIGTEGAAPVVARAIKADLEERLPSTLGTLARIGKAFRTAANALPMGRKRRDFWSAFYFGAGPAAIEAGGVDAVQPALETLLEQHLKTDERQGHVDFTGSGPGDPELLTLKARNALNEADVVIYDRLVTPEILELARREAVMIDVGKEGFGPSASQPEIDALIVKHASQGAQVVRLKSGDPTVFGRLDEEIEAVEAANISYRIIPGITAASAAVATLNQSFTKRGRNSALRIITGHDTKGYADHDWRALAQKGEVAAIYMGKKSARFIQGRLLMHGADPDTPVTIIENASRTDQRILATTLSALEPTLTQANLAGPAITFYGLAPRHALDAVETLPQQEIAQ